MVNTFVSNFLVKQEILDEATGIVRRCINLLTTFRGGQSEWKRITS